MKNLMTNLTYSLNNFQDYVSSFNTEKIAQQNTDKDLHNIPKDLNDLFYKRDAYDLVTIKADAPDPEYMIFDIWDISGADAGGGDETVAASALCRIGKLGFGEEENDGALPQSAASKSRKSASCGLARFG